MLPRDLRAASFRGVKFYFVPEDDLEAGRNAIDHSYPDASHRYMEDNGKILPRYHITAIVAEPGLPGKLRRLINALDAPGPGTLKHPWAGSRRVMVDGTYSIRRSDSHSGYVEVDVTFAVTGGSIFPGLLSGIPAAISSIAAALVSSALSAISIPAPRSATSQSVLADALGLFGSTMDERFGSASAAGSRISVQSDRLVASTDAFIELAQESLRSPLETTIYPGSDLTKGYSAVLDTTLSLVDQAALIPPTTLDFADRREGLNNVGQLLAVATFSCFAEAVAVRSYSTAEEVSEQEDKLLAYYARICDFDGSVDAFGHEISGELRRIVSEVSEVLRESEVRLPRLKEIDVQSLPASVLIYSLYASDARLQQISDLNQNLNPALYAGPVLILEEPSQ